MEIRGSGTGGRLPLILPFSDRVCSLVDSSGPFLFPLGTVIDRPIGLEIGSSRLSSLVPILASLHSQVIRTFPLPHFQSASAFTGWSCNPLEVCVEKY